MNKETKLTSLKKTSKVFAIFAKIFEVFSYVGAGICAVAAGLIATDSLSIGLKMVQPDDADKIYNMLSQHMEMKPALIIFMILLIIFMFINAFLMRKIGTLFRNINNDYSPFIPENTKLIKIIAVLGAVIALIEVGVVPAVMVGFILWGVALLFDYGCELQTESDEIL
ncbi:MAG: hypothetical protein IKS99_08500 [Firmicutes bacterium]|nr:hypothetical protein [Bacillota bacterium]